MTSVTVPYAAWYGDTRHVLEFPDGWKVSVRRVRGAPALSEEQMRAALASPIGAKPLSALAEGRKRAVVIVDDLTRPTPADKLLPLILEELKRGGLREDHVRVVMGIAAHRPMVGPDLDKKLGSGLADRLEVLNHNPYENLVSLGSSSRGTPIELNADVYEADLKIGVGSIVPHPTGGFGGGGKIVLPGVVSMTTIEHNHSKIPAVGKHGFVEGNLIRADMEEAARKAGLDFIVNMVVTEQRGVAGLFAGDLVEAHRRGVALARALYGIGPLEKADILVANAYPIDSEFLQSGKALWASSEATRENGTVVLVDAASEGFGHHYLLERGRARGSRAQTQPAGQPARRLLVYSPSLASTAVRRIYPYAELLRTWPEIVEELLNLHGRDATVTVLPTAAIQCS
ncbi:MAG: nickel-dependent lactate racemase [Candidatus Bathyarchaeia archaeon]